MTELVDPDIAAYAEEHTSPFSPSMTALLAEAAASLPYPQMLSGVVVGRLLETLVFTLQPKLVVEIGTYAGVSALAMAAALPADGRLVTFELVDEHADFAQRHIDASPYADRIEIRRGPALEGLANLDGPYDLVFIDADKGGYPDYYEAALEKLAPRGVIAIDNTLRSRSVLDPQSEEELVIDRLNTELASDERVVAVQLTVRDGLTLIRRR